MRVALRAQRVGWVCRPPIDVAMQHRGPPLWRVGLRGQFAVRQTAGLEEGGGRQGHPSNHGDAFGASAKQVRRLPVHARTQTGRKRENKLSLRLSAIKKALTENG